MRKPVLFLSLLVAFPVLADLIVPQAAAPKIIIPVAGNAAGANGTYFRSDVTVVNLRNVSQKIGIFWLPQGSSGTVVTPLVTLDIPANRGFTTDDFVDNILRRTGLGAVEILGVQGDGVTFDPDARLHVASRIWTPRPDGGAGTYSQTFPAIIAGATPQSNLKVILGMRRFTQYRLNVGMTNPSSSTQHYVIQATISGAAGVDAQTVEVDVPPRSMQQVLIPGTSQGIAQVTVQNTTGTAGDWHAWASSIDNDSGDAWSQIGFPAQ